MPVVRISDELFKEIQKYAEPIVDTFESALWKALKARRGNDVEMNKSIASKRIELTNQKEYWRPILESLVELGGKGDRQHVEEMVEHRMKGRMKAGDYALNTDGYPKWQKAVNFQRFEMVRVGLLANNSPRGIWEITDKGRMWLDSKK